MQSGETPEQAVEPPWSRENKELHEASYILRKALGFMAVTAIRPRQLYAWIESNGISVAPCCQALGMRREGYYEL